jgi:hypothetical protein
LKKNKCLYVCFYDEEGGKTGSLAANSKIEYLTGVMKESGLKVEVFNLLKYVNTRLGFRRKIYRIISYISINMRLFYRLLFGFKGTEVIIYHSLFIIPAVGLLTLISSNKVILEVEEVYTDVGVWPLWVKKIEIKYLGLFKKYILASSKLSLYTGENSRFVEVSGDYNFNQYVDMNNSDFGGVCKLLYAGIIDYDKKGAFNAIESAKYLDGSYELHVAGFGEVEALKLEIEKINKISLCKVYYDGCYNGVDFDRYCSGFDIGLSTQTQFGQYSDTSFPSKILTYLSSGMPVVSPDIACVRDSPCSPYVYFYSEDSPKAIAETIKRVKVPTKLDMKKLLLRLNNDFSKDLKSLIEN